jgi:hypothetical protein
MASFEGLRAASGGAEGRMIMLYWALVFFVIAIVAAFVLSLIAGLIGRRPPAA